MAASLVKGEKRETSSLQLNKVCFTVNILA